MKFVPFVSVIIRSYKRPGPLLELVENLRRQTYPDFEIVIVDQSNDPSLVERIESLGDQRIRLFLHPPLGAAGARNEGVRQARGEILVFIDDDDLPVRDDWIQLHVNNYRDPNCMGVTGRLSPHPAEPAPPRFPRIIRWLTMRHTFFMDPWTFPVGSLRKEGVDFLVGNNFSVRSEIVRRIGGWDEQNPLMHEEHSFAFKFKKNRRPGEYFVYDPLPVVWRRVSIAGGAGRRVGKDWYKKELLARLNYYHGVVDHYFPWRFKMLYPLYLLRAAVHVSIWIFDPDNRDKNAKQKLMAVVGTFLNLPRITLRSKQMPVRRVPQL